MVLEITLRDVENVLTSGQENKRVAVIMFYGPTCGPCKATMPFYEEVTEYFQQRQAKFDFYRINAWEPGEQQEYCKAVWDIKGVPQFKIFYDRVILVDRAGGGDFQTMKDVFLSVVDMVFTSHGEKV